MEFLVDLPKPFLALAPMDDVTDTVFRQIVAGCAKPDLFFTEFVNVDGLQSPGRARLLHKLKLTDQEGPVVVQLWGLKPDNYYKTVKEITDGTLVKEAMGLQGGHASAASDKRLSFAGVDINMGCPVKTVIKNGACSALINHRELAGEIIKATREAAGNDFPVSVKTRVGFTTVDLSWLEFLLEKKLNMLTIHGRTAKQMSKVPADWQLIGQAVDMRDRLSPTTLMVGNGDVTSRRQAEQLARQYRLDGIMIGRGIFSDPFLFSQSSRWQAMSDRQKIELFIKHIELHLATYRTRERRFETLRKFCKVYINGFGGASELREQFMQTQSPDEALALLAQLKQPSLSYQH